MNVIAVLQDLGLDPLSVDHKFDSSTYRLVVGDDGSIDDLDLSLMSDEEFDSHAENRQFNAKKMLSSIEEHLIQNGIPVEVQNSSAGTKLSGKNFVITVPSDGSYEVFVRVARR